MAVTNALQTYGDVSRREDVVLGLVEILTAKEDQIFNMLGKTKAIDEVHSFLVDTLLTTASQAVEQAQDYTYTARTTPTRLTNIVEEVAIPIRVSTKQAAIEHYHGQNELNRQVSKAMMEWGNAAEFDLVRSTLVSGISGTVAKMAGLIQAISKSTNTTSHTSGTVWSATILDGLMQDNWTNSNGDVAQDLFMGGILRRNTDLFIQKTNMVVNAPGATNIIRTVTTYETAFGTLTIHKHRYIQQSADATGRVLAIRPEKLKIAFLEKPYLQTDLSKAGPYEPRAVYGSMTLETRNQDSNFFADGFLKA